MKFTFILSKVLLVATILINLLFVSCKKLSDIQERATVEAVDSQLIENFFAPPKSTDEEIIKIAENWSSQAGFKNDLPLFIAKNGYPLWDKAVFKFSGISKKGTSSKINSENNGIALIPLKDAESSEVKSYVVCNKHGDSVYSYRLYNKSSLIQSSTSGNDSLKKASNLSLSLFAFFEKEVNGKDSIALNHNANQKIVTVSNFNINSADNTVGSRTANTICGHIYTISWLTTETVNGETIIQKHSVQVAVYCQELISGWDPSQVGTPSSIPTGGNGSIYYYTSGGLGGGGGGSGSAGWWNYANGYNGVYLEGTWFAYDNLYPFWSSYPVSAILSDDDFILQNLLVTLGLNQAQFDLLKANLNMVQALQSYLASPYYEATVKITKIKEHIDLMLVDYNYLSFCQTYTLNSYSTQVWWLNEQWLNANYPNLYSNYSNLNLKVVELFFLVNNPAINSDVKVFLDANENSSLAIRAAKNSIGEAVNNSLTNFGNPAHTAFVKQNITSCCPPQYFAYVAGKSAILKLENPSWSDFRCTLEAHLEILHDLLDGIGLFPVVGEVADVINGVIYTIQGQGTNAALSFAATIPIGGWAATAAKWARKTITLANGSKTALNWYKRADGFISFGKPNSSQFRKLLGLAPGDPRQAHHIIPWELCDNIGQDVIQKAASARFPFHVQDILNGVPLTTAQHIGSHPQYTERVRIALQEIKTRHGVNLTPEIAYQEIVDLTNRIKAVITANPNVSIENIIF
jgi:hypothetical protein